MYSPTVIILIVLNFFSCNLSETAFEIIWNSPTEVCKIKYKNDLQLELYEIRANLEQKWRGELINLFYHTQIGSWPLIIEDKTTNKKNEINGGIPQRGNVSMHLKQMELDIEKYMPNKNFEGLAVIDFEQYLPWWSLMDFDVSVSANIHVFYYVQNCLRRRGGDASIAYFKSRNPSITNNSLIVEGTKSEYENAVKLFMIKTLKKAKDLRPRAKWGYYDYPTCARQAESGYFCDKKHKGLNVQTNWLYKDSLVLFPNCYINIRTIPDAEKRAIYILKRMNEAKRMSRRSGPDNMPIYAYIRYHYEKEPFPTFLSKVDMENSIGQAIDTGLSGIIGETRVGWNIFVQT
ncbi:hyaluronidase-like [Gordionus sp. m RMFG-2023]|uniref:hyaluronidase-like n=1 Tax=Gordionus sp. m RMFG-2023 TaxID=3053472 RepID=UPI0031FCCCCC